MTGLAIMLIGIAVSLPISLVLCAGSTEVAFATFTGFTIISLMRWVRQRKAQRKRLANQASDAIGAATRLSINADFPRRKNE
jgi:membrane protein implicated in regulation of membrane protease activity